MDTNGHGRARTSANERGGGTEESVLVCVRPYTVLHMPQLGRAARFPVSATGRITEAVKGVMSLSGSGISGLIRVSGSVVQMRS